MPNSRRGALGIVRKVSILCIVAFAHFLDHAMGTATIHTVIVWFYIGNEGLSVIENAAKAGAMGFGSRKRSKMPQPSKKFIGVGVSLS